MSNRIETTNLRAGHNPADNRSSIAVPLHNTSAYSFGSSQHAADLFAGAKPGFIYTRLNNPTVEVLEQRIAALEGGIGAVITSSGTSAISTTLLTLLKPGDHIVASQSLYGGTFNLLNVTLRRYNIHTTFVDANDLAAVEAAIQPTTKLVYTEVLGNPKLDFVDVSALSELAHKYNLPVVVDNTVTPITYRPGEHGADIVIHSLTKYISGNGTVLGGAVVDTGNYNWANGHFSEFVEPNPGYHGVVVSDAFGAQALLFRLRFEGLRDLGPCIAPASAHQILNSLETLTLRYEAIGRNAQAIAEFLQSHPLVEWVNYPGLASSPYHAKAKENLTRGFGGIVTFGPKGGYEAGKKVSDALQLFIIAANLGDSKSLAIHPASTTHQQLDAEAQLASGVTPDLIRLSIGLEHIEDIKADLDQALRQ